ncbi:MAG: hypothetical protein EAZ74_04330 [Alphaproteobacteria bacterium]|nr:MAG: hypothetical protein EAZ74_04330 [Alphaproteobacteria bacterium]
MAIFIANHSMKRTNLIDALLSDLVVGTHGAKAIEETVASASKCFTEDNDAEKCALLLDEVYWMILDDFTLCQHLLPLIALTNAILWEFTDVEHLRVIWANRAKQHNDRIGSLSKYHLRVFNLLIENN